MTATSLFLSACMPSYAVSLEELSKSDAPAIKLPSMPPQEHKVPTLLPTEQKIYPLLQAKKYSEARDAIRADLRGSISNQDRAELLNLSAYVNFELEKYSDALKDLNELKTLTNASPRRGDETSPATPGGTEVTQFQSMILAHKRIGDTYLRLRKRDKAFAEYSLAHAIARNHHLEETSPAISDMEEAIVGVLFEENKYNEAQHHAEELVAVCKKRAESRELLDVIRLMWAYIHLLQIYDKTDPARHDALQSEAMPLIAQLMVLRMTREGTNLAEEEAKYDLLGKSLLASYIEENKPESLADYLWLGKQFRMRTLPLISWERLGSQPKATILCVHGLGLENRAFGALARRLVDKGFAVFALDVRGFGAWQSEYGAETVSFDRALSDVHAVIKVLKAKRPGVPLFLLGESMGGAIVLRAAAEYGADFDGVISSVPSPDRHGGALMALKVGLHLGNPNKPFNIGEQVAEQATSSQDLRNLWMRDPKAKTDLSPVELIKFDRFMKETRRKCATIRNTPIIVVQGMADKLVKPEGTYEMYDRVNSPDKTMIIIGNAEHLIFETPNQSTVLIDGLSAWLYNHVTKPQAMQSEPQAMQSEPQATQSESQAMQSEPSAMQSEPRAMRWEPRAVQSEPRAMQSEPPVTQSEPQAMQSTPLAMQSEPSATQSTPHAMRSEPRAMQSTSLATQLTPQTMQSTPQATQSTPQTMH